MAQNTAKIIDFEQFRASRAVASVDSVSIQPAMWPLAAVPAYCLYYWPCQPVVFWPGVVGV
jgi:hypothetical protein